MRIIGGNFKGKKIFQPNDFKTRPLKDLTKESIFNIIVHKFLLTYYQFLYIKILLLLPLLLT